MADEQNAASANGNTETLPAKVDDKNAPAPAAAAPVKNEPTPAPAKKDEQPAPGELKLELPEGSELDASAVDKIASFAKEQGLSQDQAAAILKRESDLVTERRASSLEQLQGQSETWKQELLADKDFGGEKAAETAQLAHDVAKRFGSESFVSELDRTGLGNHPDLVKMLARIGRAMEPDKLRGSGNPAGSQRKSTEEVLYGGTKT